MSHPVGMVVTGVGGIKILELFSDFEQDDTARLCDTLPKPCTNANHRS
jgi:hypothetical protein